MGTKYFYDRGWDEGEQSYLIHSTREKKTEKNATKEEIDLSGPLPTKAQIVQKIPKALGKENQYLEIFQSIKDDPNLPKTIKIKKDKILSTSKEPNLAGLVKVQFPGKKFQMACQGSTLIFHFENPLTVQEKAQLDLVVSGAKNAEKTRITLKL